MTLKHFVAAVAKSEYPPSVYVIGMALVSRNEVLVTLQLKGTHLFHPHIHIILTDYVGLTVVKLR